MERKQGQEIKSSEEQWDRKTEVRDSSGCLYRKGKEKLHLQKEEEIKTLHQETIDRAKK